MLYFAYLSIFILGSAIGSFLNVLIDRLPRDEGIGGRSHCDYCGKKLNWYDMFPILSYFILLGKTRCCGKKLSWQYPLIEFVTGCIFVFIFKVSPYVESLTRTVLIASIMSCLLVIFVSDLKYQLISDYILLALFIFSILFHFSDSIRIYPILSAIAVFFPIWLIYFVSHERAMGLGDVYLSAIIGFLLGWKEGLLALYIAFITGAIFGVIIIFFKNKKLKSKIAFGPFLVIGTVAMLFWGKNILAVIKTMYGF